MPESFCIDLNYRDNKGLSKKITTLKINYYHGYGEHNKNFPLGDINVHSQEKNNMDTGPPSK